MPQRKGWNSSPRSRRCAASFCWRSWCGAGTGRDRGGALSFAQYAALADSLAKVMDEVETQGADLSNLKDLAPADLAEHWEGVTRFLDVIRTQWPAILEAETALNPAERRVQGLKQLAARLEASPPQGWVIAAGSTGSIPATAELLARDRAPAARARWCCRGWTRGWMRKAGADLDPGHPQFGLAQLLRTIACEREDVEDWFAADTNPARETLLSETLRPAPTTDAWRALAETGGGEIAAGLKGIALSVAADPAQEALAIALALRQALETPGRRAALVTPDRNLARRVAAEMTRWGIAIDDSAGRPLAHTAAGSFLCLLAEAADARFAPVPLLALLKHPFARRGEDHANFPRPRPRTGPLVPARTAARSRACRHRQGDRKRAHQSAQPAPLPNRWRGWRCGGARSPPSWRRWKRSSRRKPSISAPCARRMSRRRKRWPAMTRRTACCGPMATAKLAAELCAALKDDSRDLPPIEPGSYRAAVPQPGDEGAGARRLRPPSAPRHSGPAGSAAAAFRPHHPGRIE